MSTTKEILIPIGLPSLKVAWLQFPHPLTEAEYQQIVNVIGYCRDAMVAKDEEVTNPNEAK